MLYNIKKQSRHTNIDCLTCEHFDKRLKKCVGGIGKTCFEYDEKTMTLIDPVTKLPLHIKGE